VKFLVDENLSPQIATAIKQLEADPVLAVLVI